MAKRLVLDLKGIIDDTDRHKALIEKLKSTGFLSNKFLYRGTDMDEIGWLEGKIEWFCWWNI